MCDSWICQNTRALLADISEATCTPLCADVVEGYKWRIEIIYRELLAKELVGELNDREKDISHLIGEAYTEISQAVDHYVRLDHRPAEHQPTTTSNGAVGRPRFELSHDQVQYWSVGSLSHKLPNLLGCQSVPSDEECLPTVCLYELPILPCLIQSWIM